MEYVLTGRIKEIQATETVGKNAFRKRTFVLEYPGFKPEYTDCTALQMVQDKTDILDGYRVGEQVQAHFNARSREWNGRWFTDLTCWKLERVGGEGAEPEPELESFTDGPDYGADIPF